MYLLKNIYLIIFGCSILHVFEEFVYPGGFANEFKQMLLKINLKMTNAWLVVTNIMFLTIVTSTLFIENTLFGLSVISITLLNGLLHIGKSLQVKRYFPGLITAALFYIPIGIFSFWSFDLNLIQKIQCLVLGLLMHLVPFLLLLRIFKNKIKNN